jgi:hypothetical protein
MKKINILLSLLIVFSMTSFAKKGGDNTLSKKEKKEGWVLLFDGKSTEHWRGYGKQDFPKGWIIEDGAIKCNGSGRGEAGAKDGGDIVTKKQYQNFELTLEWKISEGGNSGIFILSQEIEGDPIYKSSPEMQVLDNDKHPDAKLGKDGNRQAGSLYDLIPAVPQNAKSVGDWNKVAITVYKGSVIFNQNGKNVVEFHLWTDDWKTMVSDSKFKDWPNFIDPASKGFVGLQDHGDDVWYKNLKIKEL